MRRSGTGADGEWWWRKAQAGRLAGESDPVMHTQVGRSGDPAIRRSGDPAIRRSGDPAIRRSGDPAIRRSGDPAIRRSGDPAIMVLGLSALVKCFFRICVMRPEMAARIVIRPWLNMRSSRPGRVSPAPSRRQCAEVQRKVNMPPTSQAGGRKVRSHAGEHGLGNVSRMPVTVSSAAPDGLELLQMQVTCYRPLQMHESPRRSAGLGMKASKLAFRRYG